MLVLGRRDVEGLLDPVALIDALAPAMQALSEGRAHIPARVMAPVPDHGGLLAAMPGYLLGVPVLGAKLVTVFASNAAKGIDTHQALVAVFAPGSGTPLAVMDGASITAIRTAAGSALATRLLARADASTLAIIGTGVQARSHARMIPLVRDITEVRVAGRDPAKARALADEIGARAVDAYEEAIAGADIVCACTHAHEPVVRREWLTEGQHVTSVGFTDGAEVDAATVADAVVVVESRPASLAEHPAGANELAWAIRDGLLDADDVVEVGEVVAGARTGRTSDDQITLYKSVGVAVQDLVAANLVLAAARERGGGTEVEL